MRLKFLPRLSMTLLALFGLGACVASAAVQNRIAAAVSDGDRVAIPDSVHPKVRLSTDLGPAPANSQLQSMSLRFSLSDAQQAALDQLLIDQQNPLSPKYHQWLTPAQYGAQFGLSSSDIAKVTAWLTGEGFTVTGVANGGSFVTFNGTVAQVDAAFATSIHSLSLNGEPHIANITNASVPSGLGSVVLGITGLDDFRLKARIRSPKAIASAVAKYTSGSSHYMVPGDFYEIYNELPALNASITGAGVGTASGKCLSTVGVCGDIAIMGQVNLILSDVSAFRSAGGLIASAPTVYTVPGAAPGAISNCSSATSYYCPSPNLDDLGESDLDVEWSGATAPGATVLFVTGSNIFTNAMTVAIDDDVAPIVSISYGECEAGWGSSEMNIFNLLFKQANAQGQTILGPSGDEGATDCDAGNSAIEGLAVDFPASSPYVTGMGATQFNEGSGTYWLSSNGTVTAGTSVVNAPYSAMTYIPEAPWDNESVSNASGGGGGPSAFFSKPYWQVGTGVPADASRDVPDFSLNGSNIHDGYIYCTDGSCGSGFAGAVAGNSIAGGTSFSTPTMAGILALVEQKTGSRLGNANPTLYALANSSKYYTAGANYSNNTGLVFNDVTTGNNSIVCIAGSIDCPNGGSIGFSAVNGYDLASGWGSINTSNLVNDWSLVTPIPASGPAGANVSATNVIVSTSSVAAGTAVTLIATVASVTSTVTTTPTGTVQFLVNNVAVGSPVALVNGVATYSLATSCSNLGQLVISASYAGDSVYSGSKGPLLTAGGAFTTSNGSVETTSLTVTVTNGSCPSFTLSTPSASLSFAANGTPAATITATPTNGFTGTVVFSASAQESANYIPSFSFSPASVTITSTSTVAQNTTTLTLNGITSDLRMPGIPGRVDSGTMLARQGTHRVPWYAAGSGVTIASLLLLVLPRRRRLGKLLLVVLSAGLVFGASGCGGGASGVAIASNSSNASYAGTYYVTVVGTYTSSTNAVITQNTVVTVVIQ